MDTDTAPRRFCPACETDQLVSDYYYMHSKVDGKLEKTCKFCTNKQRQARRTRDNEPLFAEIVELLKQHGPLTSMELSALTGHGITKLGVMLSRSWRMHRFFVRRLVYKTSVWANIGYDHPSFIAYDPDVEQESEILNKETAGEKKPAIPSRKIQSLGLDPDDLAWMQKYRDSAARRGFSFDNDLNSWVNLNHTS